MSVQQIIKNSNYNLDLYSSAEIAAFEESIVRRDVGGKTSFYVKCLIRERDIRLKPGFGVTLDARTRIFFFTDSPGESHALDHFVKLIKRKLKAQKPYPSSVPAADAWTLRRFLETIFYTLLMLAIVSALAWLFGLFKLLR